MNKKWVYGMVIALIIIVAAGVGFSVRTYNNYQTRLTSSYQVSNPVYQDLFALNNSSGLKLNADQAKAILPILEQLKSADYKTGLSLTKEVYAQLNPQQYQALAARDNNVRRNLPNNHRSVMMRHDYRGRISYGQDARAAALPDLVVKQLQTIAGQPAVE